MKYYVTLKLRMWHAVTPKTVWKTKLRSEGGIRTGKQRCQSVTVATGAMIQSFRAIKFRRRETLCIPQRQWGLWETVDMDIRDTIERTGQTRCRSLQGGS